MENDMIHDHVFRMILGIWLIVLIRIHGRPYNFIIVTSLFMCSMALNVSPDPIQIKEIMGIILYSDAIVSGIVYIQKQNVQKVKVDDDFLAQP